MADLNTRIVINAVDKASGILNTLQENAGKIAAAMLAYFSIDLFKNVINSAANFEAQMDKVAAKGGYTAAEMDKITAAAFEIGAKFGVSGTQAGAGLEILAAAGLKASDAIKTLPSALSLAKSENVSMDAAATVLTDTISIMGLSFSDAGRAADVLTKGANLSNTSAMEMGHALKYAGSSARAAGMSIEETAAAIDVMATYGLRGENAGTGLRDVFASLANPSTKLQEEFDKLGIKSHNLSTVLDALKEAGSNASGVMSAFGLTAAPAIYALVDAGTIGLNKFRDELYKSSGASKETAETIQSNFTGAKNALVSVFDNLKNVVGTPILTPLTNAFDKLKDQLNTFIATGTADKVGQSLAKAFETAGKWALDFLSKIDFEKVGEDIRAFSNKTVQALDEIGKKAEIAGNSLTLFGSVMNAGFNVIQSSIGALGSSVAVVFGAINTATGTVIKGWGEIFSLVPMFKGVGDSIKGMGDYFLKSGEAANSFAQQLANEAVKDMNEAELSANKVQAAFKGIVDSTADLAPKLQSVATATNSVDTANKAAAVSANKLTAVTKLSATERLKVLRDNYELEKAQHQKGTTERAKYDADYLAAVKAVNGEILLETQKSIDEQVIKAQDGNARRIKLQMELDGSIKSSIAGIGQIEKEFMNDREAEAARRKEIEKNRSDYQRAMANGDFKTAKELADATKQLVLDEAKIEGAAAKDKSKDSSEANRLKTLYKQLVEQSNNATKSLIKTEAEQNAARQKSLNEQKTKLESVNGVIKVIDSDLSTDKKLNVIAETKAAKEKVDELKVDTTSTHFVSSDTSLPMKDISILKDKTNSSHTVYSDAAKAKNEIEEIKKQTESTHVITPDAKKADDEVQALEKETQSTHKIDPSTVAIDAKIEELKKQTESTHKVNVDDSQIKTATQEIANIPSDVYTTVHVKSVQENSNGGQIQHFSTGGTPNFVRREGGLGGFGGGDTVPAMLEPGEWIIKKESVKKYGDGFMAKLNAGQIQDVPKFATGGQVPKNQNEIIDYEGFQQVTGGTYWNASEQGKAFDNWASKTKQEWLLPALLEFYKNSSVPNSFDVVTAAIAEHKLTSTPQTIPSVTTSTQKTESATSPISTASTASISSPKTTNPTPSETVFIEFKSATGQTAQGSFQRADVASVIDILKEAASRGLPPTFN